MKVTDTTRRHTKHTATNPVIIQTALWYSPDSGKSIKVSHCLVLILLSTDSTMSSTMQLVQWKLDIIIR